ncbi:MAG: acyl-CoA thioesterase [Candidatus Bathyarchaeota archaeon]|nr:acyl-CoA thioesterase [Candidatus Bathyarchaeota archaeon]MDW8040790.1 thioesterase family protein [Nitrososphaerota archaeon]
MQSFKALYRVSWVDTDAAQIVHFSNFFRFFERAEEEFYEHVGLTDWLGAKDVILPRVEAFCQYKKPARFNDLLEIELTVEALKEKSVKYGFKIYNKKTTELLANGYIVAVAVDRQTLRAVPIPKEVVEKLKAFCTADGAK